jgi:hypothetical protein
MRKEVFFAILAGAVFGLIIAFGVWRANLFFKPKEEVSTSTPVESPPPQSEFGITIVRPQNSQVITESPVTLAGATKPESWVVISSEEEDYIFKSDDKGAFEKDVNLVGGVNEIVITSFDKSANSVKEKLTLVYSTEFAKLIDKEATASANQTAATEEAKAVREKVQRKVNQAKNTPLAYLGTVTDKLEQTIQISKFLLDQKQESKGEIQQVATDSETAFVKLGKTNKSLKFSDVAIGDFIIALGFSNGNGVLNAKRILITPPIKPTKREAVWGEITKIERKKVSLKLSHEKLITLEFGRRWKGPEIEELEEGNKIITVGSLENGILKVRTLFVLD